MQFDKSKIKSIVSSFLKGGIISSLLNMIFHDFVPFRIGLWIKPSKTDHYKQIKSSLFFRLYESPESRLIIKHLNRKNDVIEMGSSIGAVSSLIRKIMNENKKLYCVEANPFLIDVIRSNLEKNKLLNNTQILNMAYLNGDKEKVEIFINEMSENTSIFKQTDKKVEISTINISKIRQIYTLEKFSLIMDIEGAEWSIFNNPSDFDGCTELIAEIHKIDDDDYINIFIKKMKDHFNFDLIDRQRNVLVFKP
jgi:FkbM family methyltransferase